MNEQVLVSVICTAYNHEKYIRDALEGFVMQKTTFPFEILIHDDASSDKTAEIIREYENEYPEIVKPIYQSENQYSKHDGTIKRIMDERARGKYIALCEGDDYWTDPYKLQKQFDFMENHPDYTLCACSVKWLNMINGKIMDRCSTDVDIDITLHDVLFPKKAHRPFVTVSVFLKANVWKERPLWGFPIGDMPLAIYACLQGKVRMLADNMCVYRWQAKGSWTEGKTNGRGRVLIYEKYISAFNEVNKYTDYKYNNLIQKKIRECQYFIALIQHDFKAIQETDLIEIYNSRSLLYKISDRLRCMMPAVHHWLLIILGRR